MVLINPVVQPSRKPITELVGNLQEGAYYVDNSFQRKLVWTDKQKVRLIETILMNYPIPEIYIWDQGADPTTGKQRHSIVDGQQRLSTLRQFISNEFLLKPHFLNQENVSEGYAGKYWKDLRDEDKKTIWEYLFNVRTIPNQISLDEIRAVFMRLNETDKSLNPQELRNAEFNGAFIEAAEEIAGIGFWRKWNIFNEAQIRRMIDIEFTSSLLIFLRNGIVSDTASSINEAYDIFNDNYEYRQKDIDTVSAFLDFLDALLQKHPQLQEMFTTPNNIYSLFAVYIKNQDNGLVQKNTDKLLTFIAAYSEKLDHKAIHDYREGSSSRTRSKSNREKRVFSLEDWLLTA